MRVVIQKVNHAAVSVDGAVTGEIGTGFLLLVGLAEGDTEEQVHKAAEKISKMRIFQDENGKTNLALKDVDGAILSVSQFTLLADTRKGNRPSFTKAMRPPKSRQLWELFNDDLRAKGLHVETGIFGGDMKVDLENDGPFTIVLDL